MVTKMKRLYALLFVVTAICAFAGCHKKIDNNIVVSSDIVVETSDGAVSNVMPDVESETGDVIIDISELLDESDSIEITNSESKISSSSSDTANNSSSKVIQTNSSGLTTVSTSQIVSETDNGIGYTSGWIN